MAKIFIKERLSAVRGVKLARLDEEFLLSNSH